MKTVNHHRERIYTSFQAWGSSNCGGSLVEDSTVFQFERSGLESSLKQVIFFVVHLFFFFCFYLLVIRFTCGAYGQKHNVINWKQSSEEHKQRRMHLTVFTAIYRSSLKTVNHHREGEYTKLGWAAFTDMVQWIEALTFSSNWFWGSGVRNLLKQIFSNLIFFSVFNISFLLFFTCEVGLCGACSR